MDDLVPFDPSDYSRALLGDAAAEETPESSPA
jgi:hypothetical protein